MATVPSRYLTFLIVTCVTIASIVYYLTLPIAEFSFSVDFFVLLAVLPYAGYMFYYEFKTDRRENLNEGLVTEENKVFMIDTYCKFLFPFVVAMFYSSLVNGMNSNFHNFDNMSVLYFLIQAYICLVLPILSLVDLNTTKRTRNPAPGKDMIILLFLCCAQCSFRIVASFVYYGSLTNTLPLIAQYLVLALLVVNGYVLYDYINHRQNGGTYYIMFGTVNDLNPNHRNDI